MEQFENEVIRPALIAGDEGVIRDMAFERCDIKGPAIFVLVDQVAMEHNRFDGDRAALFWEIGPDRPRVIGAIAVENCRFVGCHFMQIGIAGPTDLIAMF
jgi:hypothetical protein